MGRLIYDLRTTDKFNTQLQALTESEAANVRAKVGTLVSNPHPDGTNSKLKLRATSCDAYRLRVGSLRVLYGIDEGEVVLIGVSRRATAYDAIDDLEVPERPPDRESADFSEISTEDAKPTPVSSPASETDPGAVPVAIDAELLHRLKIPSHLRPALLACSTLDDLIVAHVPRQISEKVFAAISEPRPEEQMAAPRYVVDDVDDLMRHASGELVTFLLKLDEEQQQVVSWALEAGGPTLVKGGPGTGKSVMALYRVREVIRILRNGGVAQPRILYTTYTNALTAVSEQLLRRLLGPDIACVTIATADRLANQFVRKGGKPPKIADRGVMLTLIREAIRDSSRLSDGLPAAVSRLSTDYICEEFESVIEARGLESVDQYLEAPRTGRRVPLSQEARRALWAVYEKVRASQTAQGLMTYGQVRQQAAEFVAQQTSADRFDAVVVDEAQDLDATALRLLTLLSKRPNGIFVTADANQSIYGSSFRWADVHQDLRFTGRTQILKTNYRATAEIGRAAASFLGTAGLDEEYEYDRFLANGPPPEVISSKSTDDELAAIREFIKAGARFNQLSVGACAVLVPAQDSGRRIADQLSETGIPASFMRRDEVDLEAPSVKVLTLQGSKGLEFPIVAIAGYLDHPNPGFPTRGQPEEVEEWLLKQRRTAYVGMTRAMRGLLVIRPRFDVSRVLDGFDPALWAIRDS